MAQHGRRGNYRDFDSSRARGTSHQQQTYERSPQNPRLRKTTGNQGGRSSSGSIRQHDDRPENAVRNSIPPRRPGSSQSPRARPSSTMHQTNGTSTPKPCRYHQQGQCRKGSTCPFAHTRTPLQSPRATHRQDPYNADDELTDPVEAESSSVPFPPSPPPYHTAPPPAQPLPTPNLLQRAQDHATHDSILRLRHPTLTPPRWYLCTHCASQTAHPPHHIISNPYLFTSLALKDDAAILQDDINGAYIWAIGAAKLPIQCKLVDARGAFYSCEYLQLNDALYVPEYGMRELGTTNGVNTLCLAALERDGVAGHVYVFGGVVFVEFAVDGGAVMWGVERSVKYGERQESIWEVVLCRRAGEEEGHRCGVGCEGNRRRVGGHDQSELDGKSERYDEVGNGGWKPRTRHGKHVHFEDQRQGRWGGRYAARSRSRSRSRNGHGYQ